MSNEAETALVALETEPTDKSRRERSAVAFPYSDLRSAIRVGQVLYEKAGASCDDEQLASWLNQTANSGTFRSRLSAARMFGLVDYAQGRVTLTAPGREAIDDSSGLSARADAFLKVSLYNSLYSQLRGHALPPAAAIERLMITAGVSSKQADRARQAFINSAQFAGFIDPATGRFIKPGFSNAVVVSPEPVDVRPSGGDGDSGGYHPFIVGLLKTLPPPESEWSVVDRAKWLQTAASIFGLIYKGEGSIKVDAGGGSSASP